MNIENELTLLNQDSRFTLTGSRYWNKLNPDLVPLVLNTDYDYIAEYDPQLLQEFQKRGYSTRTKEWSNGVSSRAQRYCDADTRIVLYFDTIQIILKDNVQAYIDVQNILTPEFYVRYLWKRYTPVSYIQETLRILLRKPT